MSTKYIPPSREQLQEWFPKLSKKKMRCEECGALSTGIEQLVKFFKRDRVKISKGTFMAFRCRSKHSRYFGHGDTPEEALDHHISGPGFMTDLPLIDEHFPLPFKP